MDSMVLPVLEVNLASDFRVRDLDLGHPGAQVEVCVSQSCALGPPASREPGEDNERREPRINLGGDLARPLGEDFSALRRTE